MAARTQIASIKERIQVFNPQEGLLIEKGENPGVIIEAGETGDVFKGISNEALSQLAITLNKLALYDKDR